MGLSTTVLAQRAASTALALAASAIVLWWLLAEGAGEALIDAVSGARLWPLIIGGLLAIAIQMIRAWRFDIMRTGSLALPSWTMIGIATKLVLFNFLLPFKLGELSFPLMLKRAYGTALSEGAGILILCRVLDLGVVAAMILVLAAWLIETAIHGWNPGLITLLGLAALIAPFLIADLLPWMRRLTGRWAKIDHLAGQMSRGTAMIRPFEQRAVVAVLTLSIWLAHAVIAWLAATAIAAGIGFPSMAMASASSNLAFALPISGVAGLGPPQAAWATMLHWAGHDWTPAITSALLCHGVLLTTLFAFGVAFWIRKTPRMTALAGDHDEACDAPASPGGR